MILVNLFKKDGSLKKLWIKAKIILLFKNDKLLVNYMSTVYIKKYVIIFQKGKKL